MFILGTRWVGWNKTMLMDDEVELTFNFSQTRLFHHINIHTNNMFTKDVQVKVYTFYTSFKPFQIIPFDLEVENLGLCTLHSICLNIVAIQRSRSIFLARGRALARRLHIVRAQTRQSVRTCASHPH